MPNHEYSNFVINSLLLGVGCNLLNLDQDLSYNMWPLLLLNNKFHRGVKGRAYLKKEFSKLVAERRANPANDLISFLCEAKDNIDLNYSKKYEVDKILFLPKHQNM